MQYIENKKIKKEYICGGSSCRKRYGTNAALYTHIKNKHSGVTPTGTMRPSSESIKGRKGRPQQLKPRSSEADEIAHDKLNIVKVMSSSQFQDLIYLLGCIGDNQTKNEMIRDQDEDYGYITKDEIEDIKSDCEIENYEIKENQMNYMIHSSPFWKQEMFYPLYFLFICSFAKISYLGKLIQIYKEFKHKVEQNRKLGFLKKLIEKYPQKVQITMAKLSEL